MKPADAPLNNRASLFKQTEPPLTIMKAATTVCVRRAASLETRLVGMSYVRFEPKPVANELALIRSFNG